MGGNLCFDTCTPEGRPFLIAGSHMAALLSCSRGCSGPVVALLWPCCGPVAGCPYSDSLLI